MPQLRDVWFARHSSLALLATASLVIMVFVVLHFRSTYQILQGSSNQKPRVSPSPTVRLQFPDDLTPGETVARVLDKLGWYKYEGWSYPASDPYVRGQRVSEIAELQQAHFGFFLGEPWYGGPPPVGHYVPEIWLIKFQSPEAAERQLLTWARFDGALHVYLKLGTSKIVEGLQVVVSRDRRAEGWYDWNVLSGSYLLVLPDPAALGPLVPNADELRRELLRRMIAAYGRPL